MANNAITATEYLLPNGQRREVQVVLDDDTYTKAEALQQAGYAFEMEYLRTGDLSCTVSDKALEIDVGIKLSIAPEHTNKVSPAQRVAKTFEQVIDDTYLKWVGHMTHAGEEWPIA